MLKLFAGLLATGAAGCSEGPSIDLRQFDMDLCSEAEGWHPLRSVAPEEAVDYLELRLMFENEFVQGDERFGEPLTLDAAGQRCAGAPPDSACSVEFEALPLVSEFGGRSDSGEVRLHKSLAYTRAETAGVLGTNAELLEFLGDIDTPGDAVLWGSLHGHELVCGEGNDVGSHAEGFVLHTTTGNGCGNDIQEHVILVRPDGETRVLRSVVVEDGNPGCSMGLGRIPDGFCRRGRSRSSNPVGRFLAQAAELEAASVDAFAQFGAELRAHGAPRPFVAGAESARQDEVRHARVTSQLAKNYGSAAPAPRVRPVPLKGMVAMAADNAAEGCVRETYGALVAHAQARAAQDPEVRRVMRTIARDETRHAALSWRVAGWARARMGSVERARVRRSARQSVERLREELTAPLHPQVHAVLGVPRSSEAGALFAGLHESLFRQLEA